MIGSTVSHYRIIEKLGEGGMGVVYKAHDTKLDRMVALKFLPHHLSVNESEAARFLQEARAAATLNHPNVCTIFDIKEEAGQQFIVMEFVDGATLRSTIDRSQLSLSDAIAYGTQIGDALQEAHAKGIVHRDVKAENIMVNAKRQIKVMDFGLAKLKGSLKLTRTSSTVGTLAYMAPEQIQGGEVDARSDIFSFGVVLFEMLTGRLPFRGEHEAALMYSIVNEEPEPLQAFLPTASSELLHIMNRALEKDPEDRYQTVQEMVIDLRRLKKDSSRVSRKVLSDLPPAVGEPGGGPPARPPHLAKSHRAKMWVGIGVAATVILGFALWRVLLLSPRVSDDLVFRPLQIPFTTIWYPGFSADGNWIAFPATDVNNVSEIYYMHISGGEPRKLTNDSLFKWTADLSPDGSQILYTAGTSRAQTTGRVRMESYVISTLGGVSKKIFDGRGYRWSPDGKRIAGVRTGGGTSLWIMDADGNNQRMVLEDSVSGRWSLAWSPDGKSIAWLRNFAGAAGNYQEIIIREIDTGEEYQLTNDRKNIDDVCWMPQGDIIFSSNRGGASNLWTIPSKGGAAVQITRGPGPDLGIRASGDGSRILYLQQTDFGAIQIGDLDGLNGRQVTPDDQNVQAPAFSPDGKTIAFLVADQDPLTFFTYLYIVEANGRNRRRLTTTQQLITSFAWSPDGLKLAYSFTDGSTLTSSDSTMQIAVIEIANSSQRSVVGNGRILGWMKDGASLNAVRNGTSWRVPLQGEASGRVYEDSTIVFDSPDLQKQAIEDLRASNKGIWIAEHGIPAMKLVNDLADVRWAPDGRSLYYLKNDEVWTVSLETGNSHRYPWRNPEVLSFDDISPDGRHTVFVKRRMNAKLILIENLR